MNRDAELARGDLGTVFKLEDPHVVQLIDDNPGLLGGRHGLIATHLGTDGIYGAVERFVDVAGKHLGGSVVLAGMHALGHHGAQHGLQRGIHIGVDAEQSDRLVLPVADDSGERTQGLAGRTLGHVGVGDILPALELDHRQVGDGGADAAAGDMTVGNLDDRGVAHIQTVEQHLGVLTIHGGDTIHDDLHRFEDLEIVLTQLLQLHIRTFLQGLLPGDGRRAAADRDIRRT